MEKKPQLITIRLEVTVEATSERGNTADEFAYLVNQLKGVHSARALGVPAIEFVRQARDTLSQLLAVEEAKAKGESPMPVVGRIGYAKYEV